MLQKGVFAAKNTILPQLHLVVSCCKGLFKNSYQGQILFNTKTICNFGEEVVSIILIIDLNMNKIIKIVSLLFLICFMVSCSTKTKQERKKSITVSILPQKTFVKKIAGEEYAVNVLIPPGANPATYSLIPSQLTGIEGAAVWFRIGYIGFEYSWKDKISELNPAMKVVDLSEGLDLIKKNDPEGNITGIDPHTWLSPSCVKIMAGKIKDVLTELNPEAAQTYKINYLKFVKEIDQLHVQLMNIFHDVQGKKIIVYHPSLSYFARDYGLEQFSLEPGGKEPTPQTMVHLMKMAKDDEIKVIYIQGEVDKDQAQVFADETGGSIIQLAPLDPYWSENLLSMAKIIRKNLQ